MKKLFVASAVAAIAITGCASNQNAAPQHEGRMMQHKHGEMHKDGHRHGEHHKRGEHKHGDRDGERGDRLSAEYTCTDNAVVHAKYNPQAQNAVITVTAPTWQLNNQQITLTPAVSGSGMRFVNTDNPQAAYEWHSNGRDGILTVKAGNTEQSLTCTGKVSEKKPS